MDEEETDEDELIEEAIKYGDRPRRGRRRNVTQCERIEPGEATANPRDDSG
jgi:hypothetical protein